MTPKTFPPLPVEPVITPPGASLYGFIPYESGYVRSVQEAYDWLKGSLKPQALRSSDDALLQFVASRLGCPVLETRNVFVPSDALKRVERLKDVQTLRLAGDAYLDYDEVKAYLEGNRPDWVCFEAPSVTRSLTFSRYFKRYKALTPLLYVFRDQACVYIRYKSDAYQYDELTPESTQLVGQMVDNPQFGQFLTEYTRSIMQARQERLDGSSIR